MDWVTVRDKWKEITGKVGRYQYMLLVLILGIVLMALPGKQEEVQQEIPCEIPEGATMGEQLERILSEIDGVGKVKVLLTESRGEETLYHRDEDSTVSADSESLRVETVIISGSDRGEYALIQRIDPPCYLGAIIVCQGADSPAVRLQVAEAVAGVTGIGMDRITVLKMK